jgi:O-antigen ligase
MRLLLTLLLLVLTASDVLAIDVSLGPGLSLKNALLNLLALLLLIRIVVSGGFRIEIPAIVGSLVVVFLYAALSILVASAIIAYPHYNVLASIVQFKTGIVDQTLMLLMFFYGVNQVADGLALLRMLLACVTVANLLTITNVYGLTNVGEMIYGYNNDFEANRVYGFFGHANETGTMIAVMLPGYVALASRQRGIWRLAWIGATMASFVVLIMTGSRGALAAIALGTIWGGVACRGLLPARKLLRGALPYILAGLPVVVGLTAEFGSEFLHRFISLAGAADVGDVSSGRTGLWADAMVRMMESPLSLITGFGWNVYDAMGFVLIPHNHYLMLWFELGLVGLGGFVIVCQRMYVAMMAAIRTLPADERDLYIAGVFSLLIMMVGVFFVQLFRPWLYVWPYLALILRMAVLSRAQLARASVASAAAMR